MKKLKNSNKKGMTLVEVVVALAVLSASLLSILGIYSSVTNVLAKNKEKMYFQNICLEINDFYTKYGKNWGLYYFGDENTTQYYDGDFFIVDEEEEAKYKLNYEYSVVEGFKENESLVTNPCLLVSAFNIDDGTTIIDKLNFGARRAL